MSAGHEFRALVLAAPHLLPLLLPASAVLATLDVGLGQSAVAPDPHDLSARSALPGVARAPRTGVGAALRPGLGARGLALAAVGAGVVEAVVVLHAVTVTLAGVVAAGEPSKRRNEIVVSE